MIFALLLLFIFETRFIEYRHPCPLLASGVPHVVPLITASPRIAQDARERRLMNNGTGLGPLTGGSSCCMILRTRRETVNHRGGSEMTRPDFFVVLDQSVAKMWA